MQSCSWFPQPPGAAPCSHAERAYPWMGWTGIAPNICPFLYFSFSLVFLGLLGTAILSWTGWLPAGGQQELWGYSHFWVFFQLVLNHQQDDWADSRTWCRPREISIWQEYSARLPGSAWGACSCPQWVWGGWGTQLKKLYTFPHPHLWSSSRSTLRKWILSTHGLSLRTGWAKRHPRLTCPFYASLSVNLGRSSQIFFNRI